MINWGRGDGRGMGANINIKYKNNIDKHNTTFTFNK